MADSFTFELVSPERLLLSVPVTQVTVPGSEGYMTIMADHSPVMPTLNPGLVAASLEDGTTQTYFVRGGLADASSTGFTILAEFAVPKSEMTSEIYEKQKRLAKEEHDAAAAGDDDEKKASTHFIVEQLNSIEPMVMAA